MTNELMVQGEPAAPNTAADADVAMDSGERRKKKKKDKDGRDGLGSSRGVETMFRTCYQTHTDLSAQADNKANIMISINGLIVSIMMASLAPALASSWILIIPIGVVVVACLTSLIFAVLAARPRVTRAGATIDQARSGLANILFFGNFVDLSEADYVAGMRALMQATDRVYTNMMKDLYALGCVLDRKFRMLRVSYSIFMYGVVSGVLLLLVTYGVINGG